MAMWCSGTTAAGSSVSRRRSCSTDGAADEALVVAEGQPTVVVAPYLIDLQDTAEGPVPVSYRERLRALGPTNRTDHGKQAEGGAEVEALAHASGAARSTGRLDLIKRH